MRTKVMTCKCHHEAQDKLHGKDQRVHNPAGGKQGGKWRCTVCGDTKEKASK